MKTSVGITELWWELHSWHPVNCPPLQYVYTITHYWSLPFCFPESFMLQYVGFYILIHSLSWGVVEKFSSLPRWNSKINSDDWLFAHVLEIGSSWKLFIPLYMSRENKKKTQFLLPLAHPLRCLHKLGMF